MSFRWIRAAGALTLPLVLASAVAYAAVTFPAQPVFTNASQIQTAIKSFSSAMAKDGSVAFQDDSSVSGYLTAITQNPGGDFGPDCLMSNFKTTFSPPTCSFGVTSSTKTVVVIGDSMAGEYVDPISVIAKQRGWKVYAAAKPDCLIADATYKLAAIGNVEYTSCWTWRTALYNWIKTLHPYMIIVVNAAYTQNTTPYASQGIATAGQRLLSYLSPRVSSHLVYIVQPTALGNYGRSDAQCLAASNLVVRVGSASSTTNCYRKFGEATSFYNVYSAAVKKAAKTLNPTWVDIISMFCDTTSATGYCPPVIDHSVVYRDQWHPSTAYLHRLSNVLATKIPQ